MPALSADLIKVLLLLGVAIVMFARNRPRMDAVALLMIVALPLSGVITLPEALSGFSDPNVVLIAAMFVLGEALVRTGVARAIARALTAQAGGHETRLIVLLMALCGLTGAVMSSTGVVAIFIPIVLRIAADARIAPGRLMMPLSMAALISGMLTLVGTPPNLVVQAELMRHGYAGFGFFDFTPFGLPLLGAAMLYMALTRRFLAPGDSTPPPARPGLADWIEDYDLGGRTHRLQLSARSPLVGKRLEQIDLRGARGVNILVIERPTRLSRRLIAPRATTELQPGDVLLLDVLADRFDVDSFCRSQHLDPLPLPPHYLGDLHQDIGMAEVLVPPQSPLLGKTVVEARLRSRLDLAVVGLREGGKPIPQGALARPLRAGDTLLVSGPWRAIHRLGASSPAELVLLGLPAESADLAPALRHAPAALVILAAVVALMVSGLVPNVQAALIGCLALGLVGAMDMSSAYRAIHWQSLILIVGMLPFSLALQRSGGVDLAAGAIVQLFGPSSPRMILGALFAITAILGLFISNTATAVLMAPIALGVAQDLGASPYPFAMTVALAASAAFMTPVSSPVNMLVMGPGHYRFSDFLRLGVPFTGIALLISVALVPWLLPL